ncbi:MAG: hypothetical protein RIM99_08360 [Cyclobacteriaceae bacterium]
MKRLIAISLALILLLGTTGFTYGTHFCMGRAMKSELMIGHEHMDCGMGMMDQEVHMDDQMHYAPPDCCENEYLSVDTDDLFKNSVTSELSGAFVVVTIAHVLYAIDYDPAALEHTFAVDSSPPLPDQDFQALHQVFLI